MGKPYKALGGEPRMSLEEDVAKIQEALDKLDEAMRDTHTAHNQIGEGMSALRAAESELDSSVINPAHTGRELAKESEEMLRTAIGSGAAGDQIPDVIAAGRATSEEGDVAVQEAKVKLGEAMELLSNVAADRYAAALVTLQDAHQQAEDLVGRLNSG